MANSGKLGKAKAIIELKNSNTVNTHDIISYFDRLKIENMRNFEETVAFEKLGAGFAEFNLFPLTFYSASKVAIHSVRYRS